MKMFTVNGHRYAAPEQLGKGFDVAEYEYNCRSFLKAHPDYAGRELDDSFEESFEMWKHEERTARERDVAIYAAFLQPQGGAPKIDEMWYLEASPEDLKPIDDFFEYCFKRKMALLEHNAQTSPSSTRA